MCSAGLAPPRQLFPVSRQIPAMYSCLVNNTEVKPISELQIDLSLLGEVKAKILAVVMIGKWGDYNTTEAGYTAAPL
jgi:hypothetical protein